MEVIANPLYSRPIDVHRWSDHPEVKDLVGTIWETYLPEELTRKKKTGPKPKTSFQNQLRVLILDLYVAWLEDPELSIGVSMSLNVWNTNSRYNALHLSRKLVPIVQALADVGLLDMANGTYSGPGASSNRTTRIRASETLQAMFREASIYRDGIFRVQEEEIIILRDDKKQKIDYPETASTTRMRTELREYNELIASSFIDIRTLDAPVIEIVDDNGTTRTIWIDEDAKRTRRVFSRSSWDMNGRFYGGWWQRIDSKLRSAICIDNEPTVEVDFQGLHIAMLYAEAGQTMTEDPYEIATHSFSALPPDQLRKLVKALVLTAINSRDKSAAYKAFRSGFPTGHPGKNMKNVELDRLMEAFLKRNPCLEDYLFRDRGIRLMRLDATITEHIHRHFLSRGIPVLSVHDSYIIDIHHVDELRQVMAEASNAVVGKPLRCGVDVPGYGEFDDVPEGELKEHMGKLTWDIYGGEAQACRGYVARMLAYEKQTGRNICPI